ncbi:hypothetical protein WCX18_10965 [Sulfurimonas sp. HSL1-2]|uniref:hypothetical protein n=1 Tax=Thiomicrolovo zhangzhouensis TaxID=3131933 RepID=UPI0031F9439E
MQTKKIKVAFLFSILIFTNLVFADVNASTFNVKWIGYSSSRDNEGIAKLMSEGHRDVVFIQEVVSPPTDINITGEPGWAISGDAESAAFFDAMQQQGYDYALSEEDTGTGDSIHSNSASTEWFVAFYKQDKLTLIDKGYLAEDRSNNDDYERVPYYFTFKDKSGMDFTVISTHLNPGSSNADTDRRYHELSSIVSWVFKQASMGSERDFIIVGDMNVYDCDVLDRRVDALFSRANRECLNSNLKKSEPYDQVLYIKNYTRIDNYEVLDLYEIFELPTSTPNDEVNAKYSDHHPIFFTIIGNGDDD